MRKAKVFLDTNVLLKSFLSFRRFKKGSLKKSKLPLYLIDPDSKKYTFEKCIFEVYLAFRGIGGKKPDEGRGDWANRFLKELDDPDSISKLISKFHADNKSKAFYWINEIDEISIIDIRRNIDFVTDEDKVKVEEQLKKLEDLKIQKELFLDLCDDFNYMVNSFNISILSYIEIFGQLASSVKLVSFESPAYLDSFVKRTAIPSEDFEIIFSAERIGAEIFVTDDKRLITCANSLGLNSFLSPTAFCTADEYEEKKTQWKNRMMPAEL